MAEGYLYFGIIKVRMDKGGRDKGQGFGVLGFWGFGVLGFWGFGPKARIHNKAIYNSI
jgi:hypothetical protein